MKKLFSLLLLSATISLVGMEVEKIDLEKISQKFLKDSEGDVKIDTLKSVGGLAILYTLHKSGKPFNQHVVVTPCGSKLCNNGTAAEYLGIMADVKVCQEVAVLDTGLKHIFESAFVSVLTIEKSPYTRGQELAKEIPDGETFQIICEPIRMIENKQMPVIEQSEIERLIALAKEQKLIDTDNEQNLVSLDGFKDWDGAKQYPEGWIPLAVKMDRMNKK